MRKDVGLPYDDVGSDGEAGAQPRGEKRISLDRDDARRAFRERGCQVAGACAQVVDGVARSDPAARDESLDQVRVAQKVLGPPQGWIAVPCHWSPPYSWARKSRMAMPCGSCGTHTKATTCRAPYLTGGETGRRCPEGLRSALP